MSLGRGGRLHGRTLRIEIFRRLSYPEIGLETRSSECLCAGRSFPGLHKRGRFGCGVLQLIISVSLASTRYFCRLTTAPGRRDTRSTCSFRAQGTCADRASANPSLCQLRSVERHSGNDSERGHRRLGFVLDPDEYLTGPDKLKTSLAQAWARGVEAIAVSRFNLTGRGPIPEGVHYLTHLTQKIVATDARESNAAAPLSSPWIFTRLPPKVMVRVQSRLTIATGDHEVRGAEGGRMSDASMEILHLPIRGYASFQRKIEDAANYFAANPEFGPGTGWHWRRWIELWKVGKLQEEVQQSVSRAKLCRSARGR